MYPKQFWNDLRVVDFPKKIFVGMSFDEDNVEKRYYPIIEKAILQTELEPLFLKDLITGDSIPIDIMKGIIESKLVLFDISPLDANPKNRNSNVMYEIGLAHTWRNKEEVILVADDVRDLPFDIQSFGVVQYNPNEREKAIEIIAKNIKFRLQECEKMINAKVIKAALSLNIEAFHALMHSGGFVFVPPKDQTPQFYMTYVPLLLNLGLIEFLTDARPGAGGYGYHVTELGRTVINFFEFPLSDDDLKEKYPSLYKMKHGIRG